MKFKTNYNFLTEIANGIIHIQVYIAISFFSKTFFSYYFWIDIDNNSTVFFIILGT